MSNYLSTKEACEFYDVGRATLWRWVAKGKIIQYKDPFTGRSYYEKVTELPLLNIKETCYLLGISRSKLSRLVAGGEIRPVSTYMHTMFSREEIDRYKNRPLTKVPSILETMEMERKRKK